MEAMTFEQAREIVRALNQPIWEDDGSPGTYIVAAYGYEDATHFLVLDGAEEWLVNEDFEYVTMDAPALLVDKATGTLLEADPLDRAVQQKIQAMDPVGTGNPDVE